MIIRTKLPEKPSAILTSDWHLRDTQPICRTDNFWETQWTKVTFVAELQQKYDCPVLCGGDLGDWWRWNPYLLTVAMENLPKKLHTVLGQHDVPQHNLNLAQKSGVFTLATSGHVKILGGVHFGQNPSIVAKEEMQIQNRKILVWHHMVWQGKIPFPGCRDLPAEEILYKYPQYDLILTGDNHKSFVAELDGRLLVNPGSLMRQDADQVDHKPRVYLWYAKSNKVEPVYIPIEEDVISREHIERVKERDERIESFISKLSSEWDVDVDFQTNLNRFFQENNINEAVKAIIWKSLEGRIQ